MATPLKPIDDVSLQSLLMQRANQLRGYVKSKIPRDLQGEIEPDDVVQEVWTAAFRHVGSYRPDGPDSFDRWLYTITNRKMIDAHKTVLAKKRSGRRVRLLAGRNRDSSVWDIFSNSVSPTGTPSRETSGKEARAAVEAALGELNPDYGEVIRMRYMKGLSVPEIAELTDKSVPAVRGLLFRALKVLRAQMGSPSKFFSDVASTDGTSDKSQA